MKKCLSIMLLACLLAGLAADAAFAAGPPEFSADFKTTDAKGKVTTGKMFMKGVKIRQEFKADGKPVVAIIRFDKKVSWTLMPEKLYLEIELPFDPAHPEADPKIKYDQAVIGTETVNGYSCKVIQITYKDKEYGVLVQWVPDKLGFAIKSQTKDENGGITSTTEFTNIVKGKQADSLFEIPAGYNKFAFPF